MLRAAMRISRAYGRAGGPEVMSSLYKSIAPQMLETGGFAGVESLIEGVVLGTRRTASGGKPIVNAYARTSETAMIPYVEQRLTKSSGSALERISPTVSTSSASVPKPSPAPTEMASLFDFTRTEPGNWFTKAVGGGGFKAALAMGGLGGAVSMATGGSFFTGAAMGMAGGYTARFGHRTLGSNAGAARGGLERLGSHPRTPGFLTSGIDSVLSKPVSINRIQERHAMLAGAGLMGALSPNSSADRNSHKRGFNAQRGNSI